MNYLQALSIGFPAVQCHVQGPGDVYEDLVWDAGDEIPDKAILDQWILGNPVIPSVNLPTYFYEPAGVDISVDQVLVNFSMSTRGARNFYLPYAGVIDGQTNGYVLPRDALVKSVSVSFKYPLNKAAVIHLRETGSPGDLFTLGIPAGERTQVFLDQAFLLQANTSLSCFLECSSNVSDPVVVCAVSWRNL